MEKQNQLLPIILILDINTIRKNTLTIDSELMKYLD